MKKWFNVLNNRVFFAAVMSLVITSTCHAATDNKNLKQILVEPKLQIAITMGFGIFAAYKWFEYFSSFSPDSAMLKIILPAVLTFLTFQWPMVLGWVGMM